jgi:hypothetical protein
VNDIRAGDLVICVDAQPIAGLTTNFAFVAKLKQGRVYTVLKAYSRALDIKGLVHPTCAYATSRFRKLNDGEDDDALIERIKRCQPAGRKVQA